MHVLQYDRIWVTFNMYYEHDSYKIKQFMKIHRIYENFIKMFAEILTEIFMSSIY